MAINPGNKMMRCAYKNGAVRIHFRLFSFARSFSLRHRLPVSRVLCQRDRARKRGGARRVRGGWNRRRWSLEEGKKGRYRDCRGREEPTVRSDARRRRRGKPATSQPDCKTLYNTKREKRERERGARESHRTIGSFTAADLLSSALATRVAIL